MLRQLARNARFPRLAALVLITGLAGCAEGLSDFDFDFRGNGISDRVSGEAAPRPEPDANGLITYDSYQVAVARRGDTVADVAARIGMDAGELARFNGRQTTDALREDEILALPRMISPRDTSDIAALAGAAIDEAEAGLPGRAPGAATGAEPVRHRVARGETAYSVARLYGVSVRALAEWNGLGPDLSVREGQFLIIPLVIETATGTPSPTEPGTSVAPLPPSASSPLPAPIETATLPQQSSGTGAGATPAPTPAASASTRFIRPVEGRVLRAHSNAQDGMEIAAATGTPVRAAGDGTVAAITQNTDQVPILVLRHADGLLTVYANVQDIQVSRGDSISRGQTVASVGPGDPSFLHFEVRRGFEAVDPADYLP